MTKNIQENKLTNVRAFRSALSHKTAIKKFYYYEPMRQIVSFPTSKSITMHTAPLDHYRKYMPGAKSDVFIVLDVEGHEAEVLRGAIRTIGKSKSTTLLIEDSSRPKSHPLMKYLLSHARFQAKLTPQNSFWQLKS